MLIILHGIAAIRKHYIACSIADYVSDNTPIVQGEYNYFIEADGVVSRVTRSGQELYNRDTTVPFTVDRDGLSFIFTDIDDTTQRLASIEKDGVVVWTLGENNSYSGADVEVDNAEFESVASTVVDDINAEFELIDIGYDINQEFNHARTEKVHVPSDVTFDNLFEDTGFGNSNEADEDSLVPGSDEWNEFMDTLTCHENCVITGSFSPYYIRALSSSYRSKIINGKVKVINITRNPSISYVMDDRTDDSLLLSLVNNVLLLREATYPIKFEDIIANGSFQFEGDTISVSEFESYNDHITVFENELSLDASGLDDFNTFASDVPHAELPNNIFEALGYDPLDYATITSK